MDVLHYNLRAHSTPWCSRSHLSCTETQCIITNVANRVGMSAHAPSDAIHHCHDTQHASHTPRAPRHAHTQHTRSFTHQYHASCVMQTYRWHYSSPTVITVIINDHVSSSIHCAEFCDFQRFVHPLSAPITSAPSAVPTPHTLTRMARRYAKEPTLLVDASSVRATTLTSTVRATTVTTMVCATTVATDRTTTFSSMVHATTVTFTSGSALSHQYQWFALQLSLRLFALQLFATTVATMVCVSTGISGARNNCRTYQWCFTYRNDGSCFNYLINSSHHNGNTLQLPLQWFALHFRNNSTFATMVRASIDASRIRATTVTSRIHAVTSMVRAPTIFRATNARYNTATNASMIHSATMVRATIVTTMVFV